MEATAATVDGRGSVNLVGRAPILSDIDRCMVSDSGGIVLVSGRRGRGKSAIIDWAFGRAKALGLSVLRLTARHGHLHFGRGGETNALWPVTSAGLQALFESLDSDGVIIIDDIELLDEATTDFLLATLRNKPLVTSRMVVASRSASRQKGVLAELLARFSGPRSTHVLENFTLDEVIEVAARRAPVLADDVIRTLMSLTNGNPRLVTAGFDAGKDLLANPAFTAAVVDFIDADELDETILHAVATLQPVFSSDVGPLCELLAITERSWTQAVRKHLKQGTLNEVRVCDRVGIQIRLTSLHSVVIARGSEYERSLMTGLVCEQLTRALEQRETTMLQSAATRLSRLGGQIDDEILLEAIHQVAPLLPDLADTLMSRVPGVSDDVCALVNLANLRVPPHLDVQSDLGHVVLALTGLRRLDRHPAPVESETPPGLRELALTLEGQRPPAPSDREGVLALSGLIEATVQGDIGKAAVLSEALRQSATFSALTTRWASAGDQLIAVLGGDLSSPAVVDHEPDPTGVADVLRYVADAIRSARLGVSFCGIEPVNFHQQLAPLVYYASALRLRATADVAGLGELWHDIAAELPRSLPAAAVIAEGLFGAGELDAADEVFRTIATFEATDLGPWAKVVLLMQNFDNAPRCEERINSAVLACDVARRAGLLHAYRTCDVTLMLRNDDIERCRSTYVDLLDQGENELAEQVRAKLECQNVPIPRRRGEQTSDLDDAIIQGVVEGLSNVEIATELHLSPNTVRNRLGKLYKAHGVSRRTDLAVKVLRDRDSEVQLSA